MNVTPTEVLLWTLVIFLAILWARESWLYHRAVAIHVAYLERLASFHGMSPEMPSESYVPTPTYTVEEPTPEELEERKQALLMAAREREQEDRSLRLLTHASEKGLNSLLREE